MENPNSKRDDDWGYPYFRKPLYDIYKADIQNMLKDVERCRKHMYQSSGWRDMFPP